MIVMDHWEPAPLTPLRPRNREQEGLCYLLSAVYVLGTFATLAFHALWGTGLMT